MIRNHHSFFSSFRRKSFDVLRVEVERHLREIVDDTNENDVIDSVKRRQSTFLNMNVSNEKDVVAHFLNIVNVNQLQWWVRNHADEFLHAFEALHVDRNVYLNALDQYQKWVDEFANQKTQFEKTQVTIVKQRFIKILNDVNYDSLNKKYEILKVNAAFERDALDDDDLSIISFVRKRRFKTHLESSTFIDEVDSIWRVWKTKMHDKMMINNDHYDIDMFAIITIIDWMNDETDEHIQSMRDLDIDHFKNWYMMMNFLSDIYDDFDFKRNMRNQFRILIMNTQDFQTFYFIFFRLSNSTDYSEIIKIEKLMKKIFWNLKKIMSIYSREFITLDEIWIILQQIYNRQTSLKKKKIATRQQRSELSQFKFNSFVSISMSFTKFVTSVFFAKSSIHFNVEIKTRDSMIDKLIVTNKCFTCDELNHIWRKCSNAHKHQKRHWHKMQMFYMNLIVESSDFDSKN